MCHTQESTVALMYLNERAMFKIQCLLPKGKLWRPFGQGLYGSRGEYDNNRITTVKAERCEGDGNGHSRHCTGCGRRGADAGADLLGFGLERGEYMVKKLCSQTSWAFPKVSRWWGSSDLIQKRTLVAWNKTGGCTEREGGFEWEGRRRRTLQHWWRLLENPWKPQGCREGAVRGCIKQRKQAWERSKAARCASTGEIAEAAMCLYCQESGRVHCVKWLGAQDDHS